MKKLLYTLLFYLSSMVLLPSCDLFEDDDPEPKEELQVFRGPTVNFGNGKATGWISVNSKEEPVEIGLELTNESFRALPQTNIVIDEVPLPQRAKDLTPFDHIQFEWFAQGHFFPGHTGPSFIGPHFDIRFFMVQMEERKTIPELSDPSGKFDVYPPSGYMPTSFIAGRGGVKGIGRAWTEEDGFIGMTKTMVLGTYNGKFTYVSPVIIIQELLSGNRVSTPYNQPQYFQESNTYYPTKYNYYKIDATTPTHHVTLSDFVLR